MGLLRDWNENAELWRKPATFLGTSASDEVKLTSGPLASVINSALNRPTKVQPYLFIRMRDGKILGWSAIVALANDLMYRS